MKLCILILDACMAAVSYIYGTDNDNISFKIKYMKILFQLLYHIYGRVVDFNTWYLTGYGTYKLRSRFAWVDYSNDGGLLKNY